MNLQQTSLLVALILALTGHFSADEAWIRWGLFAAAAGIILCSIRWPKAVFEKLESTLGNRTRAYLAIVLSTALSAALFAALLIPSPHEKAEVRADSLLARGKRTFDAGQPTEAIRLYQKAADTAEAADLRNRVMGANCLSGQAATPISPRRAEEYLNTCRRLARNLSDTISLIRSTLFLASLAQQTAQEEVAEQYLNQADNIIDRLGEERFEKRKPVLLGVRCSVRARIARINADYEAADSLLRCAEDAYLQAADTTALAELLNELGELAIGYTEFEAARDYYQRSLNLWSDRAPSIVDAHAFHGLGRVNNNTGRFEAARDDYAIALGRVQATGNLMGEANTRMSLGLLEINLRNESLARRHLKEALSIHKTMSKFSFKDPYGKAQVLFYLAVTDVRRGDTSAALANLEQALSLFQLEGQSDWSSTVQAHIDSLERKRP